MEEKKKTEYEIVASFTEGNSNFIIKQPVNEPALEDLEKLYIALGKALKP